MQQIATLWNRSLFGKVVISLAGLVTVAADASTKAYMATVAPLTGQIGTALGRIGELFKAPDLTSDSWKIDLAAQLVMIQTADAQLRAM